MCRYMRTRIKEEQYKTATGDAVAKARWSPWSQEQGLEVVTYGQYILHKYRLGIVSRMMRKYQ